MRTPPDNSTRCAQTLEENILTLTMELRPQKKDEIRRIMGSRIPLPLKSSFPARFSCYVCNFGTGPDKPPATPRNPPPKG